MPARNIIIPGADQNSLITAFYLARAGYNPLVLERRPFIGGTAVTEEFHPGFRACILDAFHGPLVPSIAKDMQLKRHRLDPLHPKCAIFAPHPDGRALLLHSGPRESADAIASFSKADAAKYLELDQFLRAAHPLIRDFLLMTPPEIDHPSSADLWSLLRAGRAFRKLGKKNMQRFIRWGPMAIADFASEFFDCELLRAIIASRGIFGAAAGPWSAGTTALLLLRCGAGGLPDGGALQVRGGAGALSSALAAAAQQAGAEIRTNAEVARILVKDGAVSGVALTTGEEIPAQAVVSSADPKRTFLRLLDPVHLAPSFLQKARNYRSNGVVARILLALDALPNFTSLENLSEAKRLAALTGRIHFGPEVDYLERAFDASKYGEFSRAPYLEAAIPSLLDPSFAPESSPAETGPSANARHVMTIHMQYAPYNLKGAGEDNSRAEETQARSSAEAAFAAKAVSLASASPVCHSEPARFSQREQSAFRSAASPKNWPSQRDALADIVINTLAEYAPDLPSKILARRVITPLDLENDYGLTGGHISHGELSLDQLFTMRPFLGCSRYATPIRGLFLCGPGTHPGVGFAGASALNASRQILKSLRSSRK